MEGEEGSELLLGNPGDPVVCSENTDAVAPINCKNTRYLNSGAQQFHVPRYTNSQVPKLDRGMKKMTNSQALVKLELTTQHETIPHFFLCFSNLDAACNKFFNMINATACHVKRKSFRFSDVLFCL